MLRAVRVTRVGDTDFLVDEQVDRFRFIDENEKVMNRGGVPADRTPLLLGHQSIALDRSTRHGKAIRRDELKRNEKARPP